MRHRNVDGFARASECASCGVADVCLPLVLGAADLDALEEVIQRRRPMTRHQQVYRAAEPMSAVYVVSSGAVKSYIVTEDGEEQIVGFHLPGGFFGFDGLDSDRHASTAVALGVTTVCELPIRSVIDSAGRMARLQSHLMHLMSREIVTDQRLFLLLCKRTAEERVAAFLLSLSAHYRRRRMSATRFRLPMSRTDMGNYLGLTIETVSRVLARLHGMKLVTLERREVELLDLVRLSEVARSSTVAREELP